MSSKDSVVVSLLRLLALRWPGGAERSKGSNTRGSHKWLLIFSQSHQCQTSQSGYFQVQGEILDGIERALVIAAWRDLSALSIGKKKGHVLKIIINRDRIIRSRSNSEIGDGSTIDLEVVIEVIE